MNKPIALITGATAGIGEATAQAIAEQYRLILCGRRADRLESVKKDLSDKTSVLTLSFDVRDREAMESAIDSLPEDWKEIDVLVNNAGNAHGLDPIHQGRIDDWEAMIDINVKGLLYLSRKITPGMVERQRGHVINIGSIAGKEVYADGNVYCASKYAVDALSAGMRIDLNPFGIKVTQICPGLVNTEFSMVRFKGDEERSAQVYKGMEPLVARDVAEAIAFCLSRPAHVNIADLLILPTAQAASKVVNRSS